MIIRNNINGRRTERYFNSTNTQLGKTLEKLSSGYRINRAGDDAAGLAISEKMRLQITGLGRARLNSIEGSRLIQTGEGALQEIQDMLDRAEYMATQSANGVYQDEVDRENLQKELEHLRSEIDRISSSANFNGIELFQNRGVEYERKVTDESALRFHQQLEQLLGKRTKQTAPLNTTTAANTATASVKPALSSNAKLDALLEGHEKGDLNIVYIKDEAVNANPTPDLQNGAVTNPSSYMVTDNGIQKDLGNILKEEIIPNIVTNILDNYSAFSYLKGSSIGIGLEYFHGDQTTDQKNTLAYVSAGPAIYTTGSDTGKVAYVVYTLGVNLDKIGNWSAQDRESLEATIAHEMIHAFMDEATSAGMFGRPVDTSTNVTAGIEEAERFPGWFREGMAQTASGHNDWIHQYANSGLRLTAASTDAQIKAQIQETSKKLGSDTTASRYSTGYLACMYLGAVIAGNGQPSSTVNAATISAGLNKLLNKVIGGTSLNDAINTLTNKKFTSMTDFEAKFNSVDGAPGLCDFTRDLLTAIGTGRGGLITGDLKETDLASNNPRTDVKLFELDTKHDTVRNVYPSDYPVLSGGTISKPGLAPTDFNPIDPTPPVTDYGDYSVTGSDLSGVAFTNGVLTVSGTGDINITMKPGLSNTTQAIELNGTGKVTLNGVNTSGTIASTNGTSAEVILTGVNTVNDLTADKLTIKNGTLIANGTISANTTAIEGAAVVVGSFSPALSTHGSIGIPWATTDNPNIANLDDLDSIKIGGTTFTASIAKDSTNAKLWLDPNGGQTVTFVDKNGVSKTLKTKKAADGTLQWAQPPRPFTVTKADGSNAVEGIDYEYEADGTTLVIKQPGELTISGGSVTDPDNNTTINGSVKLADNISSVGNEVKLKLAGCTVDVSGITKSAFDLGDNNAVILTLAEGSTNTFKSGSGYAGISVGNKTKLTIKKEDTASTSTGTGTLIAYGGRSGAGIGCDNGSPAGKDSSITIDGGIIEAHGGYGGAGIGGANTNASIGDISINDAHITATSEGHGAGIGGGWGSNADNGNITIDGDSWIDASSPEHGTGIGAGCSGDSGVITIKGNAHIEQAQGGEKGAGIGASWTGSCAGIKIEGNATIKKAQGGEEGAGIGSGNSNSRMTGTIEINTTGVVNAEGGQNGVGIGSGYNGSCQDIVILQGTINAKGGTDSTGIGAGRNSTSGNITIGDPNNPNSKIIITAEGGMKNNGGNILSYTDKEHTKPGTVKISGQGTSVRPGKQGEGVNSTSGVNDGNDTLYAYPLYLTEITGREVLEASKMPDGNAITGLPLPAGATNISIVSSTGKQWSFDNARGSHDDYVFLWMTGEDQTLTINYNNPDGSAGTPVTLDLKFYGPPTKNGVFRVDGQDVPDYEDTGYHTNPTPSNPSNPSNPPTTPQATGLSVEPPPTKNVGGIILQIGANYGETLEVPRFYLSARALGLYDISIATQEKAQSSIAILKHAINRVSSIRGDYGALQNRLEHNQNDLGQAAENMTDAESRIRDADMAEEYAKLVKLNILQQSAQAMMAHNNQDVNRVMQLFQ